MSIDPKKYVVLDVETNGLSSIKTDLLSISIFSPDTKKIYNKFLPLELNNEILTTWKNGITTDTLKNATHLTQEEVNNIIEEFELDKRIILIYGNIDEKFIKNYFKRKKLTGFEKLNFFNFKKNIISSPFSVGNITKDNLCLLYKIENVQEIHTGINDCILEWELFKKMDGKMLFITNNNVFEFNDDYIIPASYLSTYKNFKYHIKNSSYQNCIATSIKNFSFYIKKLKSLPKSCSGQVIENLINSLLNPIIIDSKDFLLENKKKLKFIGTLNSLQEEVELILNTDGTVTSLEQKDQNIAKSINYFIKQLKKELGPLINYIKYDIFRGKSILSQELVISNTENVLAICDLSNEFANLEIKTYNSDLQKIGRQLYYESNGRECYLLTIAFNEKTKIVKCNIDQVTFNN